MAVAGTTNAAATSPATMAALTCGLPGYGTCTRSMPAASLNISIVRCEALPFPTEP